MTPAQVNTSLAFTAVQATTAVLCAVAIGLWIRANGRGLSGPD